MITCTFLRRLSALAAVLLVTAVARAEDDSFRLETVRVFGPSLTADPVDSLAAVSVIAREDIELSAAEDLFDLLRLQPGIHIVRTGGTGAQTSVFLRGTNSNHVLVLIDGVRAGSANTGAYAWEQLPLNQIERVEIVRGPRGSVYGSDSIGGVIHVITRSEPDPYARVTAGSYGTAAFDGGLGYRGIHTTLSVNAGFRTVDGFSSQNPDGFSYDPDDDGLKTANLGIKGSSRTGLGDWVYSLLLLDGETEFDQGVSDSAQSIASVGFYGQIAEPWTYQLIAGYTADELESDHGFYRTGFESRRYQLSWQNQLETGSGGALGFGIDFHDERGQSSGDWDEGRQNTGLYALYRQEAGRLQLELAGRYDDNSRWGGEFTGQASLGYDLNETWQVTGSYGTAFRGPNLNEQYSPGFGGLFAGNPDLEPESSSSFEFGLRWRSGTSSTLAVSLYRTDVSDLIGFAGEAFQAINIDKARLEGMELDYAWQPGEWSLDANATFQDNKDRNTGEELLRRPREKGSLTVNRLFDNGSWLGLEWYYSGERKDFGGVVLGSYQLLNLRAGWAFAPAWRLEARGDNLLDETYEPAYGFNAAGRSWFLSLAWLP